MSRTQHQQANTQSIFLQWRPWRVSNKSLHWRHNDHDGVSNHQPHGCLLNRLFRRRSKKTSKLRVTGLCVGNSPGPVNSPHKGPVTRKMFPFDDVIMEIGNWTENQKCLNYITPFRSRKNKGFLSESMIMNCLRLSYLRTVDVKHIQNSAMPNKAYWYHDNI